MSNQTLIGPVMKIVITLWNQVKKIVPKRPLALAADSALSFVWNMAGGMVKNKAV